MGNFTVAGEPMTVHKIDDHTVQFRFAAPFWNVHLSLYGTRRAGLIDTETIKKYHIDYNEDANELAKEHGFDSWALLVSGLIRDPWRPSQQFPHELNLEIASTGPWRYKDSPTGAVVWERNPYYHHIDTAGNQLPYIDSVITTVLQGSGDGEAQDHRRRRGLGQRRVDARATTRCCWRSRRRARTRSAWPPARTRPKRPSGPT